MLLTKCPACQAQFKVQTAQLNVRQGRVMCGRCRHVFNAFETLERIEDADELAVTSTVDSQAVDGPVDHGEHTKPATQGLDFNVGEMPSRVEPLQSLVTDLATTEPALEIAQTSLPDETSVDATASRDPRGAVAPALIAYSTPVSSVAAAPDDGTVSKPITSAGDANDNPLLAAGAKKRSNRLSPAWSWAAMLAFLLLGAQCVYLFRSEIALRYPPLRPTLLAACDYLRCTVPWRRDEAAIEIIDSSLVEVPGKPGQILLTTTVMNRSTGRQDLPVLKLELTDNNNQPLVRRLLSPADYVGKPLSRDDGIDANAEFFISVTLEVASKARASGYSLKPLYP